MVAQLFEELLHSPEVDGSNPVNIIVQFAANFSLEKTKIKKEAGNGPPLLTWNGRLAELVFVSRSLRRSYNLQNTQIRLWPGQIPIEFAPDPDQTDPDFGQISRILKKACCF